MALENVRQDVASDGAASVGSDRIQTSLRIAGPSKQPVWWTGFGELINWLPLPTVDVAVPPFPTDVRFDFLGKDITDRVRRGEKGFVAKMQDGVKAYEAVLVAKPDAVVVWTDEYPEGRGMCMAAKELGIPSIEVRHGATHPYRHGHWAAVKYADWTLGSWDYRDWHLFYELPGDVVATGAVTQDPYAKVKVGDLQLTARHELQIPLEVPVICFLTDAVFGRNAWSDVGLAYGQAITFFKAFRQLQEIVPGVQLVVKKHPYDKGMGAKDFEKALNGVGIVKDYAVVEEPLVLALGASDLVCGNQSTAMTSALLMGIPCMVLGYEPFFPSHVFEGRGFAVVRNPKDVLGVLVDLLVGADRKMERLLEGTQKGGLYFGSDGDAWWRVARTIERLAGGKEVDELCWSTIPNV